MCTISRVQDGTLRLQLGTYRFRDEDFVLELHGHRITHPITCKLHRIAEEGDD